MSLTSFHRLSSSKASRRKGNIVCFAGVLQSAVSCFVIHSLAYSCQDIWQGYLGSGTLVCLKVLRTFHPSYYDKQEDDFKVCLLCVNWSTIHRLKALHREALIWRQLKHPRVHPFLGIVRDIFPDQLCLVSPWSANGNLCDFLKAKPEMDRLKLVWLVFHLL